MTYGINVTTSYGRKVIDTEVLPFRIKSTGVSASVTGIFSANPSLQCNLIPMPAADEALAISIVGDRQIYNTGDAYPSPGLNTTKTHYILANLQNYSTTIKWAIFDAVPTDISGYGLKVRSSSGALLFNSLNQQFAIKARGFASATLGTPMPVTLPYAADYYIHYPLISSDVLLQYYNSPYAMRMHPMIQTSGSTAYIGITEFWEDSWTTAPTSVTVSAFSGRIV